MPDGMGIHSEGKVSAAGHKGKSFFWERRCFLSCSMSARVQAVTVANRRGETFPRRTCFRSADLDTPNISATSAEVLISFPSMRPPSLFASRRNRVEELPGGQWDLRRSDGVVDLGGGRTLRQLAEQVNRAEG